MTCNKITVVSYNTVIPCDAVILLRFMLEDCVDHASNHQTYQGRIQEFALGGRPLSLTSRVPLKPARRSGVRCKLPQWGPGQSPGRKRIWCTIKL